MTRLKEVEFLCSDYHRKVFHKALMQPEGSAIMEAKRMGSLVHGSGPASILSAIEIEV